MAHDGLFVEEHRYQFHAQIAAFLKREADLHPDRTAAVNVLSRQMTRAMHDQGLCPCEVAPELILDAVALLYYSQATGMMAAEGEQARQTPPPPAGEGDPGEHPA